MKKPLTAKAVEAAKQPGMFNDGGGLYLKVMKAGSKSWIFRWRDKKTKKLRDMGLGSLDVVSLAEARDLAQDARKIVHNGGDPLEIQQAEAQAAANVMTFDQAAKRFIDEKIEPGSKGKTAPQWRSSLKAYASPHIGNMDVADIGTDEVMAVLNPIWLDISETASRVRMRMQNILAWCAVMGYRDRDRINPAQWEGHLSLLLPAKQKIAPVKHFNALPFEEMPALYAELASKKSLTAKALRLIMLTGTRTGEVIAAEWSEFDGGIWLIPAERMKAGKDHRVPLTEEAVRVLDQLSDDKAYLFPGQQGNKHMSNVAMLKLLKEMRPGMTVHGFRSGFRDWAAETTDHQNFVIEMALAHTIGSAVEAAYRRGDLFEKRLQLMEDWAGYLAPKARVKADVVPIKQNKKVS